MTFEAESVAMHERLHGKIEISAKVPLDTQRDLSIAYTPGVAGPARIIAQNPEKAYAYTIKGNAVAVITDGSAVLGLGNVGPLAAIPVMEGKAALFKAFAGIDAFPICLGTQDPDAIVSTVCNLEPVFGGIILECIAAPNCFIIERALSQRMNIPVLHDDQHGTAVVVGAGLMNACQWLNQKLRNQQIVINGAGAAGTAVARFLLDLGVGDVIVCDRGGALVQGRAGMNPAKAELAKISNRQSQAGSLADVLAGKNVFIGLSAPNLLTPDMVRSMAPDPVIFALANPDPEIDPDAAYEAGARVVATGRSDYPNQVNNLLAYPGIFRGALDVGARRINETMKMAATQALAGLVREHDLRGQMILPQPFDERMVPAVAAAVASAAVATGVARVPRSGAEVAKRAYARIGKGGEKVIA